MKVASDLAEVQVLTEHFFSLFNTKFTINEYKTLLFLKIYGLTSPKILIGKTGILKTNLAFTLKNLIAKGFVLASSHPTDARGKLYCLTSAGECEINKILGQVDENLPVEETEKLLTSLKTILNILNKKL